jgi:hypothetical protein
MRKNNRSSRWCGTCRSTNLPGEAESLTKTIFIFGLVRRDLEYQQIQRPSTDSRTGGDSVTLWFWGKQYDYTVTEKKIVAANDVSFLFPQKIS